MNSHYNVTIAYLKACFKYVYSHNPLFPPKIRTNNRVFYTHTCSTFALRRRNNNKIIVTKPISIKEFYVCALGLVENDYCFYIAQNENNSKKITTINNIKLPSREIRCHKRGSLAVIGLGFSH